MGPALTYSDWYEIQMVVIEPEDKRQPSRLVRCYRVDKRGVESISLANDVHSPVGVTTIANNRFCHQPLICFPLSFLLPLCTLCKVLHTGATDWASSKDSPFIVLSTRGSYCQQNQDPRATIYPIRNCLLILKCT